MIAAEMTQAGTNQISGTAFAKENPGEFEAAWEGASG
jgi:hypothetical protein